MNNPFEGMTKSKVLKFLQSKSKKINVLEVYSLKYESYINNQSFKLEDIQQNFKENNLIIRSSSTFEDSSQSSNAGKFLSILNVDKNSLSDLKDSIERVFDSYGQKEGQEVLIQPMLDNLDYSGVAFTCSLDTISPYYIINYDRGSQSDTVTGGTSKTSKTYIKFKYSEDFNEDMTEPFMKKLILICKEIEKIFQYNYLDIEYGVNKDNEVFIFQVRPIVLAGKDNLYNLNIKNALYKIYKKIDKLSKPHPNLLGDKSIFGVMPDWNPAEIIGLRPKKLALSLYKELVTDNVWAIQRSDYGYRNLTSHPLLVSFLGIPYIDVRLSINSFVPNSLDINIADKLVNFYLYKLEKNPVLHDKIEFEIVYSCYYLGLDSKLNELKNFGFTQDDISKLKKSLLNLTNNIIKNETNICEIELQKTSELEIVFDKIVESELPIIDKIYWLIENCKKLGTLPFAGIARCAFIATQFLNSLADVNIITKNELNEYLNSLSTINKTMNLDFAKLVNGDMDKKEFLKMYGHIRPGTYDILSPNYRTNFDEYFSKNNINSNVVGEKDFKFSKDQIEKIDHLLKENDISISSLDLFKFIKDSIEGREYSKFIFTKCVNKILELVQECGERFDITTEELAYLDIRRILELYSNLDYRDIGEVFSGDILNNRSQYNFTKALLLPSIITSPKMVYEFNLLTEEPNFITLKKVTSGVAVLDSSSLDVLSGKIVFIEAADPGFDFIFSKNISGLVTKFGGANSHMSIRCAEYGIPAVIGAGENNFNLWKDAELLEIDSLNKVVNILR